MKTALKKITPAPLWKLGSDGYWWWRNRGRHAVGRSWNAQWRENRRRLEAYRERHAGQRVQPAPRPGVARDRRIEDQRGARDDERHQALRQRRAGGRGAVIDEILKAAEKLEPDLDGLEA